MTYQRDAKYVGSYHTRLRVDVLNVKRSFLVPLVTRVMQDLTDVYGHHELMNLTAVMSEKYKLARQRRLELKRNQS